MPSAGPESNFQRRLAEMDERLRAMQAELEKDAGPIDGTESPLRAPARRAAVRGSVAARDLRGTGRGLFPPRPATGPGPTTPRPATAAQPTTEPEPATAPQPTTRPEPASPPDPRLEAMCASLLRAARELLGGYEIALGRLEAERPAPSMTLAAGPFSSIEVLEEFERAVARLPQVAEVAIRGYEGADRAILEVRLRR